VSAKNFSPSFSLRNWLLRVCSDLSEMPSHLFFQFGDSILKAICRRTKIVCFAAKLVRFS